MFKFKMNNRTWTIKELEEKELVKEIRKLHETTAGFYFGTTMIPTHEILIEKNICEDQKRATLIHELAHCYIISYFTISEINYTDEMLADIISNSHDIIENIIKDYFKKK